MRFKNVCARMRIEMVYFIGLLFQQLVLNNILLSKSEQDGAYR